MTNIIKTYIVQSKNYDINQKSSSGGMFAELARYVLSHGGVVFGCSMERSQEGFDVKHIYIETEKDLYKLQGSKYVQSRLGNSIKKAKEFLDNERLVLFSGTPCQIAGLKAYLKQDYENLLTVDLSCTGTPSLEIFNDYIKFLEKKYKQKIVNFDFRNKEKFGWSCGNALITFEDGKQKIIYNNTSSYLNLFITKQLQKPSCQNCKYSGLDRVADVTVADAWGIENEYPKLLKNKFNKNKGISLVLINTPKGFEFIRKNSNNIISEEVNVNKFTKYNNPLTGENKNIQTKYIEKYKNNGYESLDKLFKKDLGYKFYFNKIKNHTPHIIKNIIKKLIRRTEKTDCLLYTFFENPNYGSLLTAYALQKAIENSGYTNKLIQFRGLCTFNKPFVKKYLKTTKPCRTFDLLQKLNDYTNTFVLGSDNLIDMVGNDFKWSALALLNFTLPSKKRLMFSCTLGDWDGMTKNQTEYNYMKYLIDRFDYISTREEHSKQIFENIFYYKADWINDPVFYLDKQDYINLAKDVKNDYSNLIMQYILYPDENKRKIVEHYKKETGLETVKFDGNENIKNFSQHKNLSVENWLSAILNSKFIITDSFHCVAFSLIFNRPFVCIKNTHNTVRFKSLFKRLGIEIPLIESVEDIKIADFSYDKELVNNKLNDIRAFALARIEQVLLAPKKEHTENMEMEKYNKEFMKKYTPWYKKNKLFYYSFIVPFVIPIKKMMADIKNEHNRKNK